MADEIFISLGIAAKKISAISKPDDLLPFDEKTLYYIVYKTQMARPDKKRFFGHDKRIELTTRDFSQKPIGQGVVEAIFLAENLGDVAKRA